MFTIKPRNEQGLIKEVVIGDKAKKLKVAQDSSLLGSSEKQIVVGGERIREDKQLSPTPIAPSGGYIPLPEEIGYISNYPAWAHVQAWLYYIMIPVFGFQLYEIVANQKDFSEYTVADLTVSADFTSKEVLVPVLSLLMIFFLVTCIYSSLRWLRYFGSIVAAVGIGVQVNIGYDFISNIQTKKPDLHGMQLVSTALSESYFYILALSVLVLLFTFVYLLIPKYKNSFKKPLL